MFGLSQQHSHQEARRLLPRPRSAYTGLRLCYTHACCALPALLFSCCPSPAPPPLHTHAVKELICNTLIPKRVCKRITLDNTERQTSQHFIIGLHAWWQKHNFFGDAADLINPPHQFSLLLCLMNKGKGNDSMLTNNIFPLKRNLERKTKEVHEYHI